jgi:hypothetical protein
VASGKYDPQIKSSHAYIAVMTDDRNIFIWEPQTATLLGTVDMDTYPLKYQTLELRFNN